MKKIIALSNSGKTGKTDTLINLGNLFLVEKTVELIYFSHLDKDNLLSQNRDFTLVIKLYGKIIGIESQGDPNCNLKNRLQKIVDKYNVDYIFCATRTRGETIKDVNIISKSNNYEIIWNSTYQSSNENKNENDFLNKLKAKHLLDLMKELIYPK